MRVCLMIEGQEGVTWDQWRALAETAEAARLRGAVPLRPLRDRSADAPNTGSLDAWSTINALAALTTTLKLGTLVSPVTFRHPSVLARMVVTADHVTGGRVELGIGAGWHEGEHRLVRLPVRHEGDRFDRLEEQIEIVNRSWDEEPFDFEGRFYTLEQRRRAAQAGPEAAPNLILGGSAKPRGAALAARWADEYNTVHPSAGRGPRAQASGSRRRARRRAARCLRSRRCSRWRGRPPS